MDGHGLHLRGFFLYCNECLKVVMVVNMVDDINIHGSFMLYVGYCFRTFNLCSCHHPVFERQARVASTVRKCSGATILLLLRSSLNNLAICTVNPSKDCKNPNSSASL